MNSIPIQLLPKTKMLFVVKLPFDEPLGKSDRDFSNVSTSRVNLDGEILGEPTVAIFATGKLGILKGGLLHVSDVRKILSKEDICESAMVSAQEELMKKRTGLRSEVLHSQLGKLSLALTNMDPNMCFWCFCLVPGHPLAFALL